MKIYVIKDGRFEEHEDYHESVVGMSDRAERIINIGCSDLFSRKLFLDIGHEVFMDNQVSFMLIGKYPFENVVLYKYSTENEISVEFSILDKTPINRIKIVYGKEDKIPLIELGEYVMIRAQADEVDENITLMRYEFTLSCK